MKLKRNSLIEMDILEDNDHPKEVGGNDGQLWPWGSQLEVRRMRFKILRQRHFLRYPGGKGGPSTSSRQRPLGLQLAPNPKPTFCKKN
jgi:hypothetical protein